MDVVAFYKMKLVTILYSILAIALVTSCSETRQNKEQTDHKSSISKKDEISQNEGTKLDSVPEADHTMNSTIYNSVTNFALDLHLDYYKKSRAIDFMTQNHPIRRQRHHSGGGTRIWLHPLLA